MSKKNNSMATHVSDFDKVRDYNSARARGEEAYLSNGKSVSLNAVGLHDVEFIGGLWRVQDKFPHQIQIVRDVPFVLGTRILRNERNLFEFYHARRVCENCYGKYLAPFPQYVVAKYTTDKGTYWAYGDTVEQARAFLGIKLYDEYMDLIHSVACKNQTSEKQK